MLATRGLFLEVVGRRGRFSSFSHVNDVGDLRPPYQGVITYPLNLGSSSDLLGASSRARHCEQLTYCTDAYQLINIGTGKRDQPREGPF